MQACSGAQGNCIRRAHCLKQVAQVQENCRMDGEIGVVASSPNDAFVAFEHVQKSYDGVSLVVKDLNL
jgi:hypothetical protein